MSLASGVNEEQHADREKREDSCTASSLLTSHVTAEFRLLTTIMAFVCYDVDPQDHTRQDGRVWLLALLLAPPV